VSAFFDTNIFVFAQQARPKGEVGSALEAGCDTLYSEDLQHGRAFGGLTVRNPFAASPAP
jgi:predicted nucleic acid-binding protein